MEDNRWQFRIPAEYPHIRAETIESAEREGTPLGEYIAKALKLYNRKRKLPEAYTHA